MQKSHVVFFSLKAADQKIAYGVLVFINHLDGSVKKLRKNDKVHCNVLFSCRQHLLGGVLAHDEQFAGVQGHPYVVDEMPGPALAHVNHLHIVVRVLWKMNKPRVRTYGNQLSLFQKKRLIHLG